MWLAQQKPSMLACNFWPIFRTSNFYKFLRVTYNVIKISKSLSEWFSYILMQSKWKSVQLLEFYKYLHEGM